MTTSRVPCFIARFHTETALAKHNARKQWWEDLEKRSWMDLEGRDLKGRNSWQWLKHAWLYSNLIQSLKGDQLSGFTRGDLNLCVRSIQMEFGGGERNYRDVGRIYGAKYSWKDSRDKNRHQEQILSQNINLKVTSTIRWGHGDGDWRGRVCVKDTSSRPPRWRALGTFRTSLFLIECSQRHALGGSQRVTVVLRGRPSLTYKLRS